jgi:hypothetical protein
LEPNNTIIIAITIETVIFILLLYLPATSAQSTGGMEPDSSATKLAAWSGGKAERLVARFIQCY